MLQVPDCAYNFPLPKSHFSTSLTFLLHFFGNIIAILGLLAQQDSKFSIKINEKYKIHH